MKKSTTIVEAKVGFDILTREVVVPQTKYRCRGCGNSGFIYIRAVPMTSMSVGADHRCVKLIVCQNCGNTSSEVVGGEG